MIIAGRDERGFRFSVIIADKINVDLFFITTSPESGCCSFPLHPGPAPLYVPERPGKYRRLGQRLFLWYLVRSLPRCRYHSAYPIVVP